MPTVAFSGTRDLPTSPGTTARRYLEEEIEKLSPDTLVIHGNNGNVDWTVDLLARKRGLSVRPYNAEWKRYHRPGKKNPAGMIRNAEMAKAHPDRWVVVWNGKSPGSAGALRLATEHGIDITEYLIP